MNLCLRLCPGVTFVQFHYHLHPKDDGRLYFQFVHTLGGGSQVQVQVGGGPGLGRGVPSPGLGRGGPRSRSRGGTQSQ